MTGLGSATVATLAGTARESLSSCTGGTLHVAGLDCARRLSTEALVHDDGGCPMFVCDPASPLVAAARQERPAVFTVLPAPSAPAEVTGLVLAGRLCPTDATQHSEVTTVRLQVASVVVEFDTADGRPASCEVPLGHYRSAQPDPIAAAAARILTHTNRCHGADLREVAAGVARQPVSEIAAAEFVGLDADGALLHWLDRAGSHSERLAFARTADSPRTLSLQLREVLEAARR